MLAAFLKPTQIGDEQATIKIPKFPAPLPHGLPTKAVMPSGSGLAAIIMLTAQQFDYYTDSVGLSQHIVARCGTDLDNPLFSGLSIIDVSITNRSNKLIKLHVQSQSKTEYLVTLFDPRNNPHSPTGTFITQLILRNNPTPLLTDTLDDMPEPASPPPGFSDSYFRSESQDSQPLNAELGLYFSVTHQQWLPPRVSIPTVDEPDLMSTKGVAGRIPPTII
ncbi:MAG: hypothetical protein V4490_08230 [Pseudomonadota bacterium]